jgi:putative oxidoreductase
MNATDLPDLQSFSIGLLFARIVVGLFMAAHGTQKLFGWFGGYGLKNTGEFFVQLGFEKGRFFASAASLGEIASGLLIALGFLGPVGPAVMIAVMVVAAVSVHWKNGLFATTNGIELPLLYATAGVGFALSGFGRYSLDAMLGLAHNFTPAVTWVAIVVGVVGGVANLMLRKRPLSV